VHAEQFDEFAADEPQRACMVAGRTGALRVRTNLSQVGSHGDSRSQLASVRQAIVNMPTTIVSTVMGFIPWKFWLVAVPRA
jgi:hypothetical protein